LCGSEFGGFGREVWATGVEETVGEGEELVGGKEEEVTGCDAVAGGCCAEGDDGVVEEVCFCGDGGRVVVEGTPFGTSTLGWVLVRGSYVLYLWFFSGDS